jgi:DNA mismatch endonuclease (patch repair protein)
VKSKNTQPEMLVRQLVYSLGYRYRLHRKDIHGCPDLVFPASQKAVFIHGCYWHRHKCQSGRSTPETKKTYWQEKFIRTIERDKANCKALKKLGWQILVIWECQLKDLPKLKTKLTAFLQ